MLMFSDTYYTSACRTEGGFLLNLGEWKDRERSAMSDQRASKGPRKFNTFLARDAPFAFVSRVTHPSLSSQTCVSSIEKSMKQTFFVLLRLSFRI